MSDTLHTLGVIVKADGTVELTNGMKVSAESIQNTGRALDGLDAKLKTTDAAQKATTATTADAGRVAQETARNVQQLARDVAQGDWAGAARSMGEIGIQNRAAIPAIAAAGFAVTAVAAAVGTLAYAAYQGAEEQRALNDSLILTGNYAGVVTGQIDAMASAMARGINGTVGASREILGGLVATGRFTAESLAEVGAAAQLVQRFSGASAEKVVNDFARMGDGVAAWAAKANSSYHFLDLATYKHIQALEQQGRTQDAIRVSSEALSAHLGGALTNNLGVLERAWLAVRSGASSAWAAMTNLGKTQGIDDQIAEVSARLAAARQGLAARSAGGSARATSDEQLLATLLRRREIEQSNAANRSADAQATERAIAADKKWGEIQDQNLTKAQKLNKELAEVRRIGQAAGASPGEIETQERAIRARYAGQGARGFDPYESLNKSIERRLQLAQGELDAGERLAASDRFRIDMLRQIDDAEAKIGRAKADRLRAQVEETTAVMQSNEARAIAQRFNRESQEAAARETDAALKHAASLQEGNRKLAEEVEQIGANKVAVVALERARLSSAISVQEERLARMAGIESYTREQAAIEATIAALKERQALLDQKGGRIAAVEAADAADKQRRKEEQENERRTRDLSLSISEGLLDGGRKGLSAMELVRRELVAQFAKTTLEPTIRPLVQWANEAMGDAMKRIWSAMGMDGGGEWGTGSAYGNLDLGMFLHGGGMVGAEATFTRPVAPRSFAGAERRHTGGLAGDEVPVIARRGEGVFTEGQMRALAPASALSSTVNVYVNNQTDARVQVREQRRGDGQGLDVIIDLVDEAMGDRVSSGTGALSAALQGRYGLAPEVR